MDKFMGNPMNSSVDFRDRMRNMYPDVYTRMYPHVQDVADMVRDENMQYLTNEDMDGLANEVMSRSAIIDDPPVGHNRNTLNDIARALLVRELFDRRRRSGSRPFFGPLFFVPWGDDSDRRHDWGRDMEREWNRDWDRDRGRDRDWRRGW